MLKVSRLRVGIGPPVKRSWSEKLCYLFGTRCDSVAISHSLRLVRKKKNINVVVFPIVDEKVVLSFKKKKIIIQRTDPFT